jgi:hypothetical protein
MSDAVPQPGSAKGAEPSRTVVQKAQRVPLPRRLVAVAFVCGAAALALHTLPRPYQPIPTGLVRALGDGFAHFHDVYLHDDAEARPWEAPDAERHAYARELWRHRWLGIFRELLLRTLENFAAICLVGAVFAATVRRRRDRLAAEAAGARLAPRVLATGPADDSIPMAPPAAPDAPPQPDPMALVPASPAVPPDFEDDEDSDAPAKPKNLAELLADIPPPKPAVPPSPAALTDLIPPTGEHPVVKPGEAAPASSASEPNANPAWWPKPGSD